MWKCLITLHLQQRLNVDQSTFGLTKVFWLECHHTQHGVVQCYCIAFSYFILCLNLQDILSFLFCL